MLGNSSQKKENNEDTPVELYSNGTECSGNRQTLEQMINMFRLQ